MTLVILSGGQRDAARLMILVPLGAAEQSCSLEERVALSAAPRGHAGCLHLACEV